MDEIWNQQNWDNSITRRCFSCTPYDTTWGNDAARPGGPVLQNDQRMKHLLELESAIRPAPCWVHRIAHQIDELPPCGWAFQQCVEALCQNIGARDAAAANTVKCYTVGPTRLAMMANCALCLDGWLKDIPADAVAAEIRKRTSDARDWDRIAAAVREALGEPTELKQLLVRRLLARLRFWLRSPQGLPKPDDNWRLGYFYCQSMGQFGGWDYFSFENYEPDVNDLEQRLQSLLPGADRWITLITCTWPCAPKVFRYLERMIVAIGMAKPGSDIAPDRLPADKAAASILQVKGTFLDTDTSESLYNAAVHALSKFATGVFQRAAHDLEYARRLEALLGSTGPRKVYLASILLTRIQLFKTDFASSAFKTCHFTRSVEQVW